ncbi:fimbria/pilus outer membrane usher protein [Paraburkholderia fungorum]|uniref:fimbria/pilus outer membrane usher protein n=1 Tax=Paraburkholderia fungorum TaxID=134537 RepID=UPI0038BB5E2D
MIAIALSTPAWAFADVAAPAPSTNAGFNAGFLEIDNPSGERIDLAAFAQRNRVLPGNYRVNVQINYESVGTQDLRFDLPANSAEDSDAVPCLTLAMLRQWGVDTNAPALAGLQADDSSCVDIASRIPGASVTFDLAQQQLIISVPQAAMRRVPRGYVSPDKWDNGETALMLDYNVNASHSNNTGAGNVGGSSQSDTVFGTFRAGVNVGAWRFRSTLSAQSNRQGNTFQAVSNYAQRDIAPWRGHLTLGQTDTPSDVFDGVSFTGAQIASDDSMLPDSQQGYAPVIRGVAQTNAKVTVRQRGFVIYSAFVAPGPFVIDDLYGASTGDLDVTVTEADGRETHFVQPFASLPVLAREGAVRYSASAGKYRNGNDNNGPLFAQGTFAQGLPYDLTVYGGVRGASTYQSVAAGVGKNMGDFGAVSVDATWAHTVRAATPVDTGGSSSGRSFRILYGKVFESGTNFRVLGARYSTAGFRTFSEAIQERNLATGQLDNSSAAYIGARKSRVEGSVSQQMGKYGSVYASVAQQTYYGGASSDLSAQLGYSATARQFSYGAYYSQGRSAQGQKNSQVMVSVSIPLGKESARTAYASASLTHDSATGWSEQASVNGTALDDNRLSYGVTAEHNGAASLGGNGYANYNGRYGSMTANVSAGNGYQQIGASAAGSVVVHKGGVTLGQTLGGTAVLVDANGAADVGVASYPGVRTDSHGFAVVPSAAPYRSNRVILDPEGLPDQVELKDTIQEVVPTNGALVRANYATQIGIKALLTLQDSRGQPLPFGAQVYDAKGQEIGMVSEAGEAYVTGLAAQGELNVTWGDRDSQRCTASYAVTAAASNQLPKMTTRCTVPPLHAASATKDPA